MSFIQVALAEDPGLVSVINDILPGGIANIFFIGLGIGAILALGTIIFAGILYSTAGDNESRQKEARAWIWAAAKGLAVIAFGFIIVSVVNPKATTIEDVDLEFVELAVPETNVQPVVGYIPPTAFPSGARWRGTYSSSTAYLPGDEVAYKNVSYIALEANTGVLPTDTSKWQVLSSAGLGGGGAPLVTGAPAYSEVPLLKQGSSPWGGKKYGANCSGTYGSSGCGATSLAMVMLYFTGNRYMTPTTAVETVGNAIVANKWRPCNHGTAWAAMIGIPKLYGLKSAGISNTQRSLASCLRNGGIVIALMKAPTAEEVELLKNTPRDRTPIFTLGGHYIVVKGIDESKNRVYINDPAGRGVRSSEIGHFMKYRRMTWCINNK
ncbi:MAG: C39 family peptidase [Parcubacteria group bacterium]